MVNPGTCLKGRITASFFIAQKEVSLLATKNKGGRPPKYKKVEEIEGLIDKYFEDCEGRLLNDAEGRPVLNKYGLPVFVDVHPPTVTGLAYALGFTSRLGLLRYQGKPEFSNAITRAKLRIEAYNEERLYDKDGVNGAKFNLKNNFKGWAENPEPEIEQDKDDDGFIAALNGTAADDWKDEGNEESEL